MSYSDPFQTVIYDKSNNNIIRILPNRYIARKRMLAQLAGRSHWSGIGFFYHRGLLPSNIPLSDIKVHFFASHTRPFLIGPAGIPLEFHSDMLRFRNLLSSASSSHVIFEGGAGDQFLEASAVLTAMDTYPNCDFSIICKPEYVDFLSTIDGICPVFSNHSHHVIDTSSVRCSMTTPYISDPRSGLFGKASLYGAYLGLESVNRPLSVTIPDSYYLSSSLSDFFSSHDPNVPDILIQFRSASGHSKSWQYQKVVALSEMLSSRFHARISVVGRPRELPPGYSFIQNLCGKINWLDTFLLTSRSDLVICIDSGVLHMARACSTPYICLWGGTNPQLILGEHDRDLDIRLHLDCFDRVCYDCPEGRPRCMENITPQEVFSNAENFLIQSGYGQL